MINNAKTVDGLWQPRLNMIIDFVKNISILSAVPALLLILLFALTVILLVKLDIFAFSGFFIFLFYSFYKIANMSEDFYPRHFSFLILPIAMFFIFPLIYFYQKAQRNIKVLLSALLLGGTLFAYPYASVNAGIRSLFRDTFTKQWPVESRDNFAAFVLQNKARVYFYDYHRFSLPDNLGNNLIVFTKSEELPKVLKSNEYIGLILYASSNMDVYNKTTKGLFRKYKVVKTFGDPKGSYDINDEAPLNNPTIVMMK